MNPENITPIRKQYLEIKSQYPNAIVFFRLGDFYETFDEDAETTSRELDIVLTSRNAAKGQRVPMAGIPFHAADNYIARLISKGYHVAVCEQIGEQPKQGLFPRKVTKVITPGTIIDPGLIKSEKNNYLACISQNVSGYGFAYLDLSTGEFCVTEFAPDEKDKLNSEISRLLPSEILLAEGEADNNFGHFLVTFLPIWKFELGRCEQLLKRHFNISSLAAFGIHNHPLAISAAGSILGFVNENDPTAVDLLNHVRFYSTANFMQLDDHTRRNLELSDTHRGSDGKSSLLSVIDKTTTPMGKRLIRTWVNQPLVNLESINQRQKAVDFLFQNGLKRAELREILKKVSDLERIINRVISARSTPRDLVALRNSLEVLPQFPEILGEEKLALFFTPQARYEDCQDELHQLQNAIVDDPPANLLQSGFIKAGYSDELDELMESTAYSRQWISNLENIEKERTAIKTLKVGYNKVYGYYIEVSKSYLNQVPQEYIRKQTLVNAERFITPELKEYETLVLNAEERILELEKRLYDELCRFLTQSGEKILRVSQFIAHLDTLLSFAQTASDQNYVKPQLFEDKRLVIQAGRHPVVERTQQDVPFIPNDTLFQETDVVHIITGPNMSGKSTYLRQVALIVLLAQTGSYVPAEHAQIGLVDRIFTRIGAQDEIAAGQSTFMVEMVETANILHNATPRSLLILDEIGRGTSTYDGLSMAWAIIENIHNDPHLRARTLFATHYHELTQMADVFPGICNYCVAVSEIEGKILFLHKIIAGGADRSYGVHVAQLAGIPTHVIKRAYELLNRFENHSENNRAGSPAPVSQIPLFSQHDPITDELQNLELNTLSPIDALNKLYEWKRKLKRN